MKPEILVGLALVSMAVLFSGCVTAHRPVMTVVPAAGHDIRIHMLDTQNGWALTEGPDRFRVLHTTIGARIWQDVTPRPFPYEAWAGEFPRPSTAWISLHTNSWTGLLMTTNGGSSWAPVKTPFGYFTEPANVHFYHDGLGIARLVDNGAGSGYYTFYETQDGGMTWKQMDVTPPGPNRDASPGTFRLSNFCGDNVGYYPPGRFVIAFGDSGDEKPKGYARLSLSADGGKSWRDRQLPLPDEWRDGQTWAELPVFFGARDGLLPVHIFKLDDNSRTNLALLFYRTGDGGDTWTLRPSAVAAGDKCDVISLNDIVVRSGDNLCHTRDGAKTWRTIKPNIDLGREGSERDVTQMDFADVKHGWMIIADNHIFSRYGNSLLYETSDGGKTWMELPLKISR